MQHVLDIARHKENAVRNAPENGSRLDEFFQTTAFAFISLENRATAGCSDGRCAVADFAERRVLIDGLVGNKGTVRIG